MAAAVAKWIYCLITSRELYPVNSTAFLNTIWEVIFAALTTAYNCKLYEDLYKDLEYTYVYKHIPATNCASNLQSEYSRITLYAAQLEMNYSPTHTFWILLDIN